MGAAEETELMLVREGTGLVSDKRRLRCPQSHQAGNWKADMNPGERARLKAASLEDDQGQLT